MKKLNRIRKNSEFQRIIKTGKLTRTNLCYGYYVENNVQVLRIGVAVSKKIGNAVVRNKIKRQIRALVHPYVKTHSGDFVLVAKSDVLKNSFLDLTLALNRIFEKNGETNEKK